MSNDFSLKFSEMEYKLIKREPGLPSNISLDLLSDACLFKICFYLPNDNLLQLALVSKRFYRIAYQSLHLRLSTEVFQVQLFPTRYLLKFGSLIKRLGFSCEANAKTIEKMYEICPNLIKLCFKGVYSEAFYTPVFWKTLTQLQTLEIENFLMVRKNFVRCRAEIEAILQCCDTLTTLSLGNDDYTGKSGYSRVTIFDPFFNVRFPKLHKFSIKWNNYYSSKELFKQFFQINTNLRSLRIESRHHDLDVTGILSQPLEELVLVAVKQRMNSIIPSLCQLKFLRRLNITAFSGRDILEPFLTSLKFLQYLTSLQLAWGKRSDSADTSDLFDFNDEDLVQIVTIPNLTIFRLRVNYRSNVTLPGILKTVRYCPRLICFQINGFRQITRNNSNHDDIYNTFRRIYRERAAKSVFVFNHIDGYGQWYHICPSIANSLGIFRRCLE